MRKKRASHEGPDERELAALGRAKARPYNFGGFVGVDGGDCDWNCFGADFAYSAAREVCPEERIDGTAAGKARRAAD
jgi:hypothetical protein